MKTGRTTVKWSLITSVAVMLLALLPQVWFISSRGAEWQGANAVMHPDEVAYSAYIATLIRGGLRRSDPYTAQERVPESLFSVQFIPAYLVSLPARWLGIAASTVFIICPLLCAIASSLAIFWFIQLLTNDVRLSAASVVIILCLGTLIASQGIVRHVPNLNYLIPQWLSLMVLPPSAYHLPFLRFYQPSIAFPLFFVLCALTWIALTSVNSRKSLAAAVLVGVTFGVLVFSYFYLWTAAAAWIVSICLVWFLARKNERSRTLMLFSVVGAFALPVLVGYFFLLSQRALTTDDVVALVSTRKLDLFRLSELVVIVMMLFLLGGIKRRLLSIRDPVVLFILALALTVVAVFNQQVITGYALQPIHYEWFIGNYCALAVVVLTVGLLWRRSAKPQLTNKNLLFIAVLALLWGAAEVWLAASLNSDYNSLVDEVQPVFTRLAELEGDETFLPDSRTARPTVLMADLRLADRLPTDLGHAVLWAPRMLVFPGVGEPEFRERFFQQLYYLGYDDKKLLKEFDYKDWNFYAGMFPYYRLSPVVSDDLSPITPAEMEAQVLSFKNYFQSFGRDQASSPKLSYMVLDPEDQPDYSNLDRWYERDSGERVGRFLLFRLKLRD